MGGNMENKKITNKVAIKVNVILIFIIVLLLLNVFSFWSLKEIKMSLNTRVIPRYQIYENRDGWTYKIDSITGEIWLIDGDTLKALKKRVE